MDSLSIALRQPSGTHVAPLEAHQGHGRGIGPFLGHFAGMCVAMLVGMPLFGMPLRALLGALAGPSFVRIPEVRALGMAVAMTLGMVLWMHVRKHSGRSSVEMAAAMIVPTVALFPALWLDMISGGTLIALGHVLMLPSMLAAMLFRRSEYGL